ncbi:MAG: AbrB/MazE/SpoVT family DNA-binding domain-containing protein [Candidatus Altiarchaeota archaeon]|nr:AbrB/MazE/SpoVT family DNA-binding domain-containing protein [Candidatus Altiarchaeota archaeon]
MTAMDTIYGKIKPNGDINLPKDALKNLGVKVGERITLMIDKNEVRIRPALTLPDLMGCAKNILPKNKTARDIISAEFFEDAEN